MLQSTQHSRSRLRDLLAPRPSNAGVLPPGVSPASLVSPLPPSDSVYGSRQEPCAGSGRSSGQSHRALPELCPPTCRTVACFLGRFSEVSTLHVQLLLPPALPRRPQPLSPGLWVLAGQEPPCAAPEGSAAAPGTAAARLTD